MPRIARIAVFGIILMGLGSPSRAIPAFARKYRTTCMTCHTTPTMLNEFGLRFQANGYQLPGTIDRTPVWDQGVIPVSFMLHAMWMWNKNTQKSDASRISTTGFRFVEPHGDLFSGGTLGPKLSYFTEFEVEPDSVKLETAWVIFNNVLNLSRANFRVGKFFFDVPFPSRLSMAEDIKPLVYAYNPFSFAGEGGEEEEEEGHEHGAVRGLGNGFPSIRRPLFPLQAEEAGGEDMTLGELPTPVRFSSPQLGVSLFGFIPDILDGTRYEIALVNWEKEKRPDWFFRLNQTIYLHDAPVRFGFMALDGRHQNEEIGFQSHFWRWGIDGEVYDPWTKKVNLQFQYLKGHDEDVELEEGNQERDMSGGFVGAHLFLFPEKFIVFGRFEWLNAHPEKTRRWTSVLRYHLAPNVFIDLIYANTWTDLEAEEDHPHEEGEAFFNPTGFLQARDMPGGMPMPMETSFPHRRHQMLMVMFMFMF